MTYEISKSSSNGDNVNPSRCESDRGDPRQGCPIDGATRCKDSNGNEIFFYGEHVLCPK